jgi:hypothetical protein
MMTTSIRRTNSNWIGTALVVANKKHHGNLFSNFVANQIS